MYKKIFSAILFGALTIASTSTFVSCNDYDEDIKSLQEQITTNQDALATITRQFEAGVVITEVQQDGSGVVLKTSSGDSYHITNGANGANGADADVWTIGADGYWYKNGQLTEYKAVGTDGQNGQDGAAGAQGPQGEAGPQGPQGEAGPQGPQGEAGPQGPQGPQGAAGADGADGLNGDYYVPNADGFFHKFTWNSTTKQYDESTTDIKWALDPNEGISAAKTKRNVILTGVPGYSEAIVIPIVNELASLVFRPDSYYWGIEATKITRLTPKWYTDLLELTSYIDDYARRNEVVGTKEWTNARKETTVNYEEEGVLADHDRYTPSSGTFTVMLNAVANYHVNPSNAYFDDATRVSILSDNKNYTRAKGTAKVTVLGAATGAEHSWSVADGILSVPLKVDGTVSSVVNSSVDNTNSYVTSFATQVHYSDTTITSDYATIVEETVSDLRLSHTKFSANGTADQNFIQTKVFNNHCGACDIYKVGSVKKGMHLFATVGEAKYVVENNGIRAGEGQDLVQYQQDIDLNKLVEVHYTNAAGNHAKFEGENLTRNFDFKFELTDFRYGDNKTNESAHAAIYQGEDGHFYLHPQDPAASSDGLKGRAYDPAKATEVVVDRVPLVRVSLIYKADGKVIDYGYLPIRIVKEKEVIIEPDVPYIFHAYTSSKNASVTRYNDCYVVGGTDIEAIQTNWRQTEEDLMSHADLPRVLTREEFEDNYGVLGGTATTAGIQYSISTFVDDVDQYYITGKDSDGKPKFAPVTSTGTNKKYGKISYIEDNAAGFDMATTILKWTLDAEEIRELAGNNVQTLTRAILLKSKSAAFPDIYVTFTTGKLSLEKKTVTANMNVTAKRINEYWYTFGNATKDGFTLGTKEIHTNVETPEEADQTGMGDGNYLTWKPLEFKNIFRNVFLNNFNSGDFSTWMTFSGAPAGGPFNRSNIKLGLIFDDSGNGTYKGKLDSGAAKSFTVKNTTTTDQSKKVLYATYNGRTEAIAEIVEPAGLWDGSNVTQLKAAYIRLTEGEYAKALLNYVSHEYIGGTDVLKATVAVVPTTQNAATVNHPNDRSIVVQPSTLTNVADGKATVTAAVKYYDNNQVAHYCPLQIEDYKFDVRFLRPISLDPLDDTVIEDATSSVDQTQIINLSELVKGFTDFRGNELAEDEDGNPAPLVNWKSPANGDNLDYEEYYAKAGTNVFTVTVQNVAVGAFLSTNPNVKTNLNQSNPNTFVALNTVSADGVDFKKISDDELEYRNNRATVAEFQVKIPVQIEYYWGIIYDDVTITIKKTQSNVKAK